MAALEANGLSHPVGMVPFDDHSGSQENLSSCDHYPLSNDQDKHGNDDILIMGSLSEIGTHEITKWEEEPPAILNSSSSGLLQNFPNAHYTRNGLGFNANSEECDVVPQHIDKDWYRHEDEVLHSSSSLVQSLQDDERVSSHDSLSQASEGRKHKRKERKSLEALTRIASSDQEPGDVRTYIVYKMGGRDV